MSRENHSRSHVHNVVRSDAAAIIDTTPGEGNLVRVGKPAFVSLVDLPANQTGFKVVRKDESKGVTPMSRPVIRRTRRSDTTQPPMLALTFPSGTTEAQVSESLTSYGMTGYKVTHDAGLYRAVRSDLQSIAIEGTMEIKLNDKGLIATVMRSDAPLNPKSHIALAAVEFDPAKFNDDEVAEWLKRNAIDSKIAETQNSDKARVVRRSAVAENEETRRMELEDGVTAVIVRSDVLDVPDGLYAVISESAYGSWGWGQLDFTAILADVAFCDLIDDAVYRLSSVLRNTLLYSELPLDIRKTLTNNATSQFGAYVGEIMDSLPRQLLVSVVRSAQPQQENSMTQANAAGGANTTATTLTPAATVAATPVAATTAAPATLTRAEVDAEVAAARLAAQNELLDGLGLQRKAPEVPTTPVPLTRSDLQGLLAEAVKPMADRLEKLEGTTIVRSAPDAATTVAATQTPEQMASQLEADKKSGAVFRGALGNIGGSRRKQ